MATYLLKFLAEYFIRHDFEVSLGLLVLRVLPHLQLLQL